MLVRAEDQDIRQAKIYNSTAMLLLILLMFEGTEGQNFCLPAVARQSNTWIQAFAYRAIDEDPSTCSVAGDNNQNSYFGWWQVDMRYVFSVYSVTVTAGYDFNNNGSWPIYVQNFTISVGKTNSTDDGVSTVCYYFNNGSYLSAGIPTTFICEPNPLSGRYVTIKRRGGFRYDAISLCEVSVQYEIATSSSSSSTRLTSSSMTTVEEHRPNSSSFEAPFSTASSLSSTEFSPFVNQDRPTTNTNAALIAAILLGIMFGLSLVVNVILILRLIRSKRITQIQQTSDTSPRTSSEQSNYYQTLREQNKRSSMYPETIRSESIYQNNVEMEQR